MIFVVMIIYTVFLTNQVINKRGSNTTLSTKIKDLQKDPEEHQPGLESFKYGVGFADPDREIFYDESIFKVEMFQGISHRYGHLENLTLLPLETQNCDSDTYEQILDVAVGEPSIARCPKYDNYTLSGTYVSETFKYLYVTVRKCSPFLGDTN